MKSKNGLLHLLSNLDWAVTCIAMAVLIFVTFLGVIMRYFFNNPLVWTEEVQLWCFVWVVFLGGGATFRLGEHVSIDILVDSLPKALRKIIKVFEYVVVIAVLIYYTKYSTVLAQQMVRTERLTNILGIPYGLIYGAFPVGCIIMIISYTVTVVQYFLSTNEVQGGV
ncbi:TRAP transporter small permease [Tepidanaerobacter sp. GT38]|uniref:TRAP transporter small permease n=1 Tax=Tepidanaerobacter sp. GT38 TaxID=2722793 RepID=UPI001F37AAB7|nr:TRAP transporter small permease [Tepidanaerobacter sp. GT38]MCG1012534.1 TRAP transporter small permease [Tepidanaerobacter sp. GT38]